MLSFFRFCSLALLTSVISGAFAADAVSPPANGRIVDNLAVFGRVYGYVRFFHPNDRATLVDWDAMAILGAELAGNAPDDSALRAAMLEAFGPVTTGLEFLDPGASPRNPPLAVESDHQVTYWQHHGVRLSEQSNIYRSARVLPGGAAARAPLFEANVPESGVLNKTIGEKLRVSLPLVLPVSSEGKTPAGDPAAFVALQERLAALELKSLTPADWRLRAGGVIAAWNVFQHFHPYLDQMGIKWEEALRPALSRALTDRTRLEYHATLSEMVAKLQDGHGYVYGRGEAGGVPIRVELIEGQIVVTAAAADSPFQKGDILLSVDGLAALDSLRDRERYVSGSPHLRRHRALNLFGDGQLNSTARIELLRDGERKTIEHLRTRDPRGFFFNSIPEFEFPRVAELKPGIFYVNLQSTPLAELQAKLPELAQAKGIIFDYRWDGRPSVMKPDERVNVHRHVIPHLIDEKVQASPMLTPRITLPDREGWTYRESSWPVQPASPRFTGRVAFINVPAVVSYGETCMAMIAHHKLATLVGEATAGCNGNANFVLLPGGFRIMWTGMDVLKMDRSPFYGTGFVPDRPVQRTLAGLKSGRDEFLEKALAVIDGAKE